MNNLTPKEIKAIFLVHDKADYKNIKQINDSLQIIKQRKILQSSKALRYKKRLALLCKGKTDYSCVYCKDKKPTGKGVICPECEKLLNRLLNGETIDEKVEIKGRIKERKRQAVSNALSLSKGLGIAAVILSILLLAGSVYLLFASWASYDDMYQKALMVPEVRTKIVDEGAKEVVTEGEELFGYVGASFESLSKKLGDSTSVIGDNIRYFDDANVSVVYNADTTIVEYIDIDGSGKIFTTLMGIGYGMTREDVNASLLSLGVDKPSSINDSTYEYYFMDDTETNTVVLSITYTDDIVVLVSATLK